MPSTGGTAIAADGTVYLADTNRSAILAIAQDGAIRSVIEDPRLTWVDAIWIDDRGRLILPASQWNRTKGMNAGVDMVRRPISVYALHVGAQALRN